MRFCVKTAAAIGSFLLFSVMFRGQDAEVISSAETPADPFPMDTLDTGDKYVKVILYSDHTWAYLDTGRPVIDTAGFFEGWDTGEIHAFKGLTPKDLPEEIDIRLVDDENPFCAPITGKVYSGYKPRRSREHNGLDVPLTTGDTIRACFNGIVRYTGTSYRTGGYGNLVVIRHSNGLETYYGHLSKILLSPNEIVKAGEVVGRGGNTGRSTGPHLHFEVRYKGQSFDPERIVNFETGEVRDTVFSLKRHYFSIYSHYGQSDEESKAASGRIVHIIKRGDTLGRLAVKYGTTVSKICNLNAISSTKILNIGDRIIVR